MHADDESDDELSVSDNVIPVWHRKLLSAAETGDASKVRNLTQRNSELAFVADTDGYTALHRAAQGNHCEVIRVLFDRGVNVNARTNDGWTPLHSACHWKHVEAAALLLDNGADINARTNGNVTALHLAAASRDKRLLELLLYNANVDIEVKNDAGDTPFAIAARHSPFAYLFKNV